MISPKFRRFHFEELRSGGIALSINNSTVATDWERRVLLLMGDGHASAIGESGHSIVNAILAYLSTEKLVLQIIVFQLLLHLNLIKLVLLGTGFAINQGTSGTANTLTDIIKPRGILIAGTRIAHGDGTAGTGIHTENSEGMKTSTSSTFNNPRGVFLRHTLLLLTLTIHIVLKRVLRTVIAS